MQISRGKLRQQRFIRSQHFDQRPVAEPPSLLVIHNISLPPKHYGGNGVIELFTGQLDPDEHPFYRDIAHLRVSAHCFIRRTGEIIQFVNFDDRAWHAGQSRFQGRPNCNDYSIGIELEGTDTQPYTDPQYAQLVSLTRALMAAYPTIDIGRIVGHNDIAHGRKTDPGIAFDWCRYRQNLVNE